MKPRKVPTAGPSKIAPTATGITKNVISTKPTLRYPMGVKLIRKMIAVNIAVCVKSRTFFEVFVFSIISSGTLTRHCRPQRLRCSVCNFIYNNSLG